MNKLGVPRGPRKENCSSVSKHVRAKSSLNLRLLSVSA